MPPVLRPRKPRNLGPSDSEVVAEPTSRDEFVSQGTRPPIYTIDLSQPPEQRYEHLIEDFRPAVAELVQLFDSVCEIIRPHWLPVWFFHVLAWLFLQRLHSPEQTRELTGLSRAFGVPMYLLVAYNVLLDLLMGCTSGGVLVEDPGKSEPFMMHFRTLDWGMPALRKAVVHLRYIERAGDPAIAATVGYVGFIGVLTGVRPGLSMSLNFRPYRNNTGSMWATARYHYNLIMVLMGLRPSICARLRDILLSERQMVKSDDTRAFDGPVSSSKLDGIEVELKRTPTAAAYLIFCTGTETMVIEKDLETSEVQRSSTFVAATNHDRKAEVLDDTAKNSAAQVQHEQRFLGIGMQDLIDESMYRKQCISKRWRDHLHRQERRRGGKASESSNHYGRREKTPHGVKLPDLKNWVLEYPICNEDTHFACIMHPIEGSVVWVRSFEEGEVESPV